MNADKNLAPGQLYTITFEDCCVEGNFKAIFLEWDFGDDAEHDYDYADAIFDIGKIGPGWGRWNAKLIEGER